MRDSLATGHVTQWCQFAKSISWDSHWQIFLNNLDLSIRLYKGGTPTKPRTRDLSALSYIANAQVNKNKKAVKIIIFC